MSTYLLILQTSDNVHVPDYEVGTFKELILIRIGKHKKEILLQYEV